MMIPDTRPYTEKQSCSHANRLIFRPSLQLGHAWLEETASKTYAVREAAVTDKTQQ